MRGQDPDSIKWPDTDGNFIDSGGDFFVDGPAKRVYYDLQFADEIADCGSPNSTARLYDCFVYGRPRTQEGFVKPLSRR